MNEEERRLKEQLLARYSEAVDEMLRRCRGKEDFGELEEEVERLAQATLPATLPRARGFFPLNALSAAGRSNAEDDARFW